MAEQSRHKNTPDIGKTYNKDEILSFSQQLHNFSKWKIHTVCNRSPSWSGARAIKANLVCFDGFEFLELHILFLAINADLAFPGGSVIPILAEVTRVLMTVSTRHERFE